MAEEKKTTEANKTVVGTRGRIFEGTVIRKFPKRVTIEFDRPVYVRKYERYFKKKTRIHSRLPDEMDVQIGDYVQVRECRPLSKTIHSIVIKKIRSAKKDEGESK